MNQHQSFIFLVYFASIADAANILVLIPFTSTSHYKFLRPVGLELARRGHNVTVVTAHKESNPPKTYHEVLVDDIKIWDAAEGGRPNVFDMVNLTFAKFENLILWNGGLFTTENTLKSQSMIEFMEKDNHFDLVISELFYQEALNMFAHKYQTPLVYINTYGNNMRQNFISRNPLQLATLKHEFGIIRYPGSFYGRLWNFYYAAYDIFWYYAWYLPKQETLVRKYFKDLPQPIPSLDELSKNVSLMLINSHFSIEPPAAYYPNIIEIAGLHIKEFDKVLPKEMLKFIDEAKDGVVYVNFGSNVRSSELPSEKRDALLNVFRKLKQRVVFKWEEEQLPGKPDNVMIRNWLPQKEILAHPNVRLFIAHGGMIGFEEAVYNAVPILGIPIYADQYNNLLQGEHLGIAKILEYKDINEESLEKSIDQMLQPEFKKNIVEVSKRFVDRPLNALNASMFWIEYVMRHRGARFMRTPALDMPWFSYMMLDVYAFLFVFAAMGLAVVYKMISILFIMLTESKKKEKVKRH